MANKEKRIILDTNLWISFLISKDFSKLDDRIFSRETILIFSQELLNEFISVVGRPKFINYFSKADILEILDFIDQQGEFVEVTSDIKKCRDEKDNFLLSLAIDGNADFLITGDKDLLVLKEIGETQIITINQFFEIK